MQPTDEDLENRILLFNDLMLCLKSASSDRLSQSQVKGAGVMTVSWRKMWPVKRWNQPCFLGNSFNKDTLAMVPLIRLKPVLAWSTIILELYNSMEG